VRTSVPFRETTPRGDRHVRHPGYDPTRTQAVYRGISGTVGRAALSLTPAADRRSSAVESL